jgi:hypothetical protein
MEFYRYELKYFQDKVEIKLLTFKLIKETEKSYWIQAFPSFFFEDKRMIRKRAIRSYAYPTKEEAFKNFRLRTMKYFDILCQVKHNVEKGLKLIEDFKIE